MRSPLWMVPYALVILLSGAAYAALVFWGPVPAMVFAGAALVAAAVAVALAFLR